MFFRKAKEKFYLVADAIFGEIGRIASEETFFC